MKTRSLLAGTLAVAALGAAGYGLYATGLERGARMASAPGKAASEAAPAAPGTEALPQSIAEGEDATRRHITSGVKAGDVDPANGHKVLYYHDPMVPGNRFDRPAKSPFMDMMLVPVYAGGGATDASQISVSPRVQQNLGLRTAAVVEAALAPQLSAVGSIAWNEREQAVVQARAAGFVEAVHVRATLDLVRQGQALAELYVPDWIAAQEEYLSLRRMQGSELAPLLDAARQRMRLVGMSEAQVALVESSGRTQPRLTVSAPIGGVVTELMLREGMTVMPGTTLLRINGVASVWAHAELPESQAGLLRIGARVQANSPALPGLKFSGRVQAILPEVDPTTRTLKARIELANPGARLAAGMFVQVQWTDAGKAKVLAVPSEAVIQTGTRAIVMLAEADGGFRPAEVQTGIESGGMTEIRRGLRIGQKVVVSGQFLLDSEASLKGLEARLNDVAATPATPAAPGKP